MDLSSNHLTEHQLKTVRKYKNRLAKRLPTFRIAWVKPVKENMIELHLESDNRTYRRGLLASQLATEVEDETDVIIILR
jgi:hypothetical protein